jgi:hypothetical protein
VISRPPTYSTASLDSVICPVMVDSKAISACLPENCGLSLPRLPDTPKNLHPIIIESWRVNNGLIEVGGVNAHRMWELAGNAAGMGIGGTAGAAVGAGIGGAAGAANGAGLGMVFGPLGLLWGAAAGAALGAAAGAVTIGAAAAVNFGRLAGVAGRQVSETNSRVIGTYDEIVVSVPCSRVGQNSEVTDFNLVLGAYTDSTASILGERVVGWGFNKVRAAISRPTASRVDMTAGTDFVSLWSKKGKPVAARRSSTSHLWKVLSQPLLGILPPGRVRVSFLERSFEADGVRKTPVTVRLTANLASLPGLQNLSAAIDALGSSPWGALALTGLPVTLSYPRDINL